MGWESCGVVKFDLGLLLPGQRRIAKLKTAYNSLIMSKPLGGGHIIFAFSTVCCHTWFPVISRKSIYPIFTKFGMGVIGLIACMGLLLVKIAL